MKRILLTLFIVVFAFGHFAQSDVEDSDPAAGTPQTDHISYRKFLRLQEQARKEAAELHKKNYQQAKDYWDAVAREASNFSDAPIADLDGASCTTENPAINEGKKHFANGDFPPDCNALVLNAEQKKYFLLSSQGACIDSGTAHIGRGSLKGDGATPGNESGENETPPGLLKTAPYDGSAFNKTTAIDLVGLESQNNKTAERGVVLHASAGPTRGCLGIEPGKWAAIRDKLTDRGCPVFVYFDEESAK